MSCRILARAPLPARPPRVERDPAIVASFLSDAAHVPGGFASGVVFPSTESEVAALLAAASTVLPVGAQSSLTGGATPRGEVVLSTRAFTDLEIIDRRHVRVGAGVPLARLQQRLSAIGLYYPRADLRRSVRRRHGLDERRRGRHVQVRLDASLGPCDYGGLANGAVLDITRGEVSASSEQSFEILMPIGNPIVIAVPRYAMPSVPKLSAGYHAAPGMDLIDLFIGSEGTLGVITQAVLRVIEHPLRATALIACGDDRQALAVTAALREQARLAWVDRSPLDVSAIEYMDARSLRAVPDAVFNKTGIERPPGESVMLLVHVEIVQGEDEALALLGEALDEAGVTAEPLLALAATNVARSGSSTCGKPFPSASTRTSRAPRSKRIRTLRRPPAT